MVAKDHAKPSTANHEELSPLLFLERSRSARGPHTALVDQEVSFTYAQLAQEVAEVADGLQIQHGQRVALLCHNHWQLVVAHFAVAHAGGVIVPLNVRLHPEEIQRILHKVTPAMLWVDNDL